MTLGWMLCLLFGGLFGVARSGPAGEAGGATNGGAEEASAAAWPTLPEEMKPYWGDPARGPEPNSKYAGNPEPPHEPTHLRTDGNPLSEPGHWRLNQRILRPPFTYDPGKQDKDAAKAERAEWLKHFTSQPWRDGKLLHYSLMAPPRDATPPEGGWPLVVVMPGVGGIGKKSMIATSKRIDPALVWAAPLYRRHVPAYVVRMHPQARAYNFDRETKHNEMSALQVTPVLKAYEAVIDHLIQENPIDPRRVVISGFSHGGSCTWLLLERRPAFYAAAAPMAGSPPATTAQCKAIAEGGTPIWMFVGNEDTWHGSAHYIFAYNQLLQAGAKGVRFWEIQDLAHRDTPALLLPLAQWLHAQRREQAPVRPATEEK